MIYKLILSDSSIKSLSEKDKIHLIVKHGCITPYMSIKKDKNTFRYYIKWFNMDKMKMCQKSYNISLHKDAKEKIILYKNQLPIYDEDNIQRYIKEYTIEEIYKNIDYFKKYFRFYKIPIDYKYLNVPIDSYFLELWLGDGSSTSKCIYNIDEEVINEICEYATSLNIDVKHDGINHTTITNKKPFSYKQKSLDLVVNIINDYKSNFDKKVIIEKYNISYITYKKYTNIYEKDGIEGIYKYFDMYKKNPIYQELKKLNLIGNKHIPDIYKYNTKEIRLNLLAGFIDTDGHLAKTCYEICQGIKNEKLFDDIIEISNSLGFRTSKNYTIKSCTYKNIKKEFPAVRGFISGDINIIPVRIERKKCTRKKRNRYDFLNFDIELIKN